MSDKDTITKEYMSDNFIFADAFNFYLYKGRQVIKSEQLKPLDTTEIVLPYGKNNRTLPIQKHRDILKIVTAKADGNAAYLLLGIENQSQIHYAMPVRNMLYNAIQYASQVDAISKAHKKDAKTSAEFLSGFHSDDKIIPVITLTVYFGADKWTAAKDLHGMFDKDKNRDLLEYIDNYHLHLIEPAAILDNDFSKFKSELSLALKYVKYSKNKIMLNKMVSEDDAYKHVSRRTANMINVVTGSNLNFQNGEESVNMCEAIRDMRNDAIAEGKKEGLIEGKIEGKKEGLIEGKRSSSIAIAKRMLSHGRMTLEDIAEYTDLSIEEVRSLANDENV